VKIFKLILLTLSILTVYEVWSNPIEETSEESTNILFWSSKQKEKGFNRIDEFIPSLPIKKGKYTYHLENKFIDLSNVSYDLYGKSYSIKDYFLKLRVAGLLVVHKGNIVYEEYGLDNDENSRWISFSVAKSVTSMLLGAAIQDGFIGSVEDPITKYLPQLVGSSYENVSIKNLLQMSSGVDWDENYSDPESDVSIAAGFNSTTLFNYLSKLPINSKPGKLFNYNTGETNLVGDLVRSAINNNLSNYLEQKIWQPFGMESDGSWSLDINHLLELGGCCINATLRDYARIGLFAMHDGRLNDGTRVLPEGWMEESTAPSKGYKG
ncbi:uncharacterized protein METZ01_LOCUS336463, partial [marine metagenome]